MNRKQAETIIRYAAIVLFAIVFVVAYVTTKDLGALEQPEKYRVLADGFTIPGVVTLGYGLLVRIAATGALDGTG